MGGFFGVASQQDCVFDLFFGVDYHSHLGTRRGGMAVFGEKGFNRAIHNIENAPFRTKFDKDVGEMKGWFGIGCISDYEPQPLMIRSHHGTYAITTVGKLNNSEQLLQQLFDCGHSHFMEQSGGEINATELVAALINQKENLIEGIHYALEAVEGSLSLILMNKAGLYAARDKYGRTPVTVGKKEDSFCISVENFAYHPASSYEGMNVEQMRYNCGRKMAQRDDVKPDIVAGVPDSGVPHAIGYANESGIPFTRPFIKYTPTWPRSFMPTIQSKRDVIAKMKLLAVEDLIQGRSMILIDDSIVRGTQLRETVEFLYQSGATEVHVRPACPPILYGCKYLNFSRSTSDMDLFSRRVIDKLENGNVTQEILEEYADPESERYGKMVEEMRKEQKFTSLRFNRLDDMLESTGLEKCKLCTYCWNGKE